ncbi:putative manganese-dependent inorganic diphosphatase [Mogibacterium timidum]|uniref:putative manganese-dependent inorganic diphosphatase n=1 Tax=Mogibacterium timidum TaxID=35519 RepID=UPI002355F5F4|nr:putative manganese-dependent inorganic diphosphatase [Mogibacterium timidum]
MDSDKKIIITGHKNPDTDSICSALAYAEIKNRITNTDNYVARRAGEINGETKFVLEKFGVDVPEYVDNVATQVRDMEIRRTPGVPKEMTIKEAWDIMGKSEAVTQPITENDKVIGLITKGDIARTFMDAESSSFLSTTSPRFNDIAATIDGRIVSGEGDRLFSKGKVLVGAALVERMRGAVQPHDLVILVDRRENQIGALNSGADCIILCLGAKAAADVIELAGEKDAVIIETELDTFSVSREINKSVPLGAFMTHDSIRSFKLDDYTDDVKSAMGATRHRAFPVTDSRGHYIGTVSRRNLLNIRRKQVILVDHNEKSQAVDNIDDADILEIVDHHRLGTIQTLQPIYFNLQPVGCTATILYQMYIEKGIDVPKHIAGLLCAAIVSDTLMFRSPTCTTQDKMAAGALALIAGIDIEKFASEMFEAGSDLGDKSAEEIFYQDYKKFTFGGTSFGVGQISSMNEGELNKIKSRLLPLMEHECGKNNVSMVFFLLTNIRESSSEMLYAGDNARELIINAFGDVSETDGGFAVEGLLSRKKQLIPAFMDAIQNVY